MGNRRRFTLPDPPANEMLPVDDQAWDDGAMGRAGQHPVSAAFAEPRAPFARLCEASLLAGRVITHVRAANEQRRKGSGAIDASGAEAILAALALASDVLAADLERSGREDGTNQDSGGPGGSSSSCLVSNEAARLHGATVRRAVCLDHGL
jgi:hypothetical protein